MPEEVKPTNKRTPFTKREQLVVIMEVHKTIPDDEGVLRINGLEFIERVNPLLDSPMLPNSIQAIARDYGIAVSVVNRGPEKTRKLRPTDQMKEDIKSLLARVDALESKNSVYNVENGQPQLALVDSNTHIDKTPSRKFANN